MRSRRCKGRDYRDIAAEEFDNTADLLAEILSRGVSLQLKRGLGREYVDRKDMLSSPRGKIELSESLKTRSILRRQLVCSYDEFSTDTRMNRDPQGDDYALDSLGHRQGAQEGT